MIILKFNEDIAFSSADVIVNASNGIGFMGGKSGVKIRKKGVAESIHFVSRGSVENLAKEKCKKHSIFGFAPGSIFITSAPNLSTKYIIHAVTMRFPGSKSRINTIEKLLPKIIEAAENYNWNTVAIPLLGTGTGRLSYFSVYRIYQEYLLDSNIEFLVYCNNCNIMNGKELE